MSSQPHAENRWNQIDRYVSGEMVEKERDLFEQRMREHAELAQQVHLHRDMLMGMEYYFMQQLKEQLALSDQKKKSFNWPLLLKIAAAVLLVVSLAGVGYYYTQRPADPEQLFLTYFEAYPNTLTHTNRSEASPGEPLAGEASDGITSAMRDYERGNFTQAAAALNKALSSADITDDQRTALTFYRGVANLQLGNVRQARSDLAAVIQSDTLLTEPATWYTGLSYLRDNNGVEAKRIFAQLREVGGEYAEKAARLLDDLS